MHRKPESWDPQGLAGLGSRVWGLGSRVSGVGFRVQ